MSPQPAGSHAGSKSSFTETGSKRSTGSGKLKSLSMHGGHSKGRRGGEEGPRGFQYVEQIV